MLHVRADMGDPTAARLANAFASKVIIHFVALDERTQRALERGNDSLPS